MARPKKQPAEKRSELIQARVTLAEKLYIEEQANIAGLSVSQYARRRLLRLPVRAQPNRVDAVLINELNRIGVNINQLAHAANAGRTLPNIWDSVADDLQAALKKVIEAYDS